MGCGSSRPKAIATAENSSNTVAVVSSSQHELEEVAELPLRAREEETDLISMVELSVRCTDLPSIGVTDPCTVVVLYKQTLG